MEIKMKILFLCEGNSCRSQMAEGFGRSLDTENLEVLSAGVTASHVHPKAMQVMQEVGIDISKYTSKAVPDLVQKNFDLVISLCDEANKYSRFLLEADLLKHDGEQHPKSAVSIGAPIHIYWPIDDPSEVEGDDQRILNAFRAARDEINKRIRILVEHEYLKAFVEQRRLFDHLADLIDDGLVAHDDSRNIFLFNRKAEEITGFSRNDVCGRDCHDVFPPTGLCGAQCRFKHGASASSERQKYEIFVTDKKGVDKRIRLTALPFIINKGNPIGTLAVLRDLKELIDLRRQIEKKQYFHGMIGVSDAMQNVFDTIRSVAASDYPVLITGESGTGKELTALAIHKESRHANGPFVPVNCGALPENILESELFGHVRGAFTGAIRNKKGRFELADGGTLFLDEVGDLPPSFQVKLLRVLQEKSFERVGGEKPINVDVRIVSATNRNLKKMIKEGGFREDLFYRLCVVPINLPLLRERLDELTLLVDHLLENIRKETGKKHLSISHESMNLLLRYTWPGNIRELNNTLQFASVHCDESEILPEHLPPEIRSGKSFTKKIDLTENSKSMRRKRKSKLKRDAVELALEKTNGNKVKAAKILGVGRATLYRFLNDNPDLLDI